MKLAIVLATLIASANALAAPKKAAFTIDNIPGALPPVGLFDPLGLASKANEATLKRYREAELTHGRYVQRS